ncbi:unnamed protein product [Phytophthora fragariaefolia]|uniref:Unnamed protein product n=1 Tax=Phytophthora fragariaefolia TaxID=1490495 RepID=A0A9W7CX81_9STRA|nr:unnamed protein product [Phytophthora fragariaefolia]
MGKRKTCEPEDPFVNTTESLTNRNKELDKLRKDLWLTTVKQLKLVQLIRNEIQDCIDSDARNLVHDITELLKRRLQQTHGLLEGSFDHSIQLYKKRRLALRSPASMAQRRGRIAERPSPDPRPRQQSRPNAPDDSEASRPMSRSRSRVPRCGKCQCPSGFDRPGYFNSFCNCRTRHTVHANERFEFLVASRGDQEKKDPPVYEGRFGEDIELWIFATEQYYANKRRLMKAESSDFVALISSNLGKSVLNWYRAFIADCERMNVHKTRALFKSQLRTGFRSKDFEYDHQERMFHLKQKETIHEYISKFQDLLSQTELEILELEKRFFFQKGLREKTAKKIKEESPNTLQEAIEIASNFEFAYYSGRPPRVPSKPVPLESSHRANKSRPHKPKRFEKKNDKNDDWTETAICKNCGVLATYPHNVRHLNERKPIVTLVARRILSSRQKLKLSKTLVKRDPSPSLSTMDVASMACPKSW